VSEGVCVCVESQQCVERAVVLLHNNSIVASLNYSVSESVSK
jgi:hypothetical protein